MKNRFTIKGKKSKENNVKFGGTSNLRNYSKQSDISLGSTSKPRGGLKMNSRFDQKKSKISFIPG